MPGSAVPATSHQLSAVRTDAHPEHSADSSRRNNIKLSLVRIDVYEHVKKGVL